MIQVIEFITTTASLINQHGAIFGAVTGAIGVIVGYRLNVLLARRAEWNIVADRIRSRLLIARDHRNYETTGINSTEADLINAMAGWCLKRRINNVTLSHQALLQRSTRSERGDVLHSEADMQEMRRLQDHLLSLIRRR